MSVKIGLNEQGHRMKLLNTKSKYRILIRETEGKNAKYIPQYEVSLMWGLVKFWWCWHESDSDVWFLTREEAKQWIAMDGKPKTKETIISYD